MNKRILRLAVPNILSNLSVPLLSSVDTAVVGHLDKVYYLGAIAVGSMIFNFIYWGFGFLRMGTTGLTAQAYGRKDARESHLIFSRAFMVALSSGIVLILLQEFIIFAAFELINSSKEVEYYARRYFLIRIYAAPATLILYVFHGWFLGLQNAKIPLLLTVVVNVLNVCFNLLFIYQFDMKSDGVALGTVVSQYLGLFLAAVIFYRINSGSYKFILREVIEIEAVKKFFRVNADIFIRTLCLVFVFSFFTAKSAAFGDDLLAANTILMQLWMIISYGIDGFAFAAESLVGKYIGAQDKSKLLKVIRYIFYWGMGIGAVTSVVYYFFDYNLISIFTDKENIILLSLSYFIWTAPAPFINSLSYIWDGIYIGATSTKAMRNSMLIATLIIFLPLYYFTNDLWGNHGLWFSITIFMIARAVTLAAYSRKHIFSVI